MKRQNYPVSHEENDGEETRIGLVKNKGLHLDATYKEELLATLTREAFCVEKISGLGHLGLGKPR